MKRPDREARKRALEARRDALREKMKAKRQEAMKNTGHPSRLWWLVLLAVLLLLALLCCNPCTPPPVDETDVGPGGPAEPAPVETDLPPPEPLPDLDRMKRIRRPALPVDPPGPPSWLDAFRMQVTARSPRLAACFEGAENPGQLRWTTSVEPVQGSVSEHSLEPMLETNGISSEERTCVLGVLSNPRYDLNTGDEPETPTRVGLVIAF